MDSRFRGNDGVISRYEILMTLFDSVAVDSRFRGNDGRGSVRIALLPKPLIRLIITGLT